jgi:nucleoside-diphosphate-sugar epimerase
MKDRRIVLPGGAGLVGQNLAARLTAAGYTNIVVLDKHRANLEVLRRVQPRVQAHSADLSQPGDWQRHFEGAEVVVLLQAQIGGNDLQDFVRNNVDATRLVLQTMRDAGVPYLVHVSSSVVESSADDFYTQTKREQERVVLEAGLPGPILRPTLMFGWFDRKHLGWLARFMKRVPVFPIPGHGRYMRQPLYVGDFCRIIIGCIEQRVPSGVFNISGHERIDYIDIIRHLKRVTGARASIVRIPYAVFHALLGAWSLFDRNPPFTTQQLAALIAKDEFEVIDWPGLFGVPCTPFAQAIAETFNHPEFGHVELEF